MIKIGIPAQDQPEDKFGVNKTYLDLIYHMGYLPVIITPTPMDEFFNIYKLDGLVVPGGADVNPQRYTKLPQIFTGNSNIYLEYFDKEILPNLVGVLPIFGICRGLQTLNVLFGGTLRNLWNHPYSQYDEDLVHEVRDITIKNGQKFKVNSFHHQAIKNLAPNFRTELVDDKDGGVVEAISDFNSKIFAVQWHPERCRDAYSLNHIKKLFG